MLMKKNLHPVPSEQSPETGRVSEPASSSKGPLHDAEQRAREAAQASFNEASQAGGDAELTDNELDKHVDDMQFTCAVCKTVGTSHMACKDCRYVVCTKCISDELIPICCNCGEIDRRPWTETEAKLRNVQAIRKTIRPANIDVLSARLKHCTRPQNKDAGVVDASGDAEQNESSTSSNVTRKPPSPQPKPVQRR